MKIDFEKYEKRLNSLVNDSIDCIAGGIRSTVRIRTWESEKKMTLIIISIMKYTVKFKNI